MPDAARVSDGEVEGIRGSLMAKALDDEGHERRRWMAGRGFTARWAATLEPGMEAVADRTADGMPDHGSPAELVDSLPTSFRRNPALRAAEERDLVPVKYDAVVHGLRTLPVTWWRRRGPSVREDRSRSRRPHRGVRERGVPPSASTRRLHEGSYVLQVKGLPLSPCPGLFGRTVGWADRTPVGGTVR
ncbi:hypothetical protein ACIRPN_24535 [Streptomyces sp. NPDC101230]|uniref:hypothetical protein n=1 Tax=unclassified Streptomyces TaxID=2593676 RepID=UPI003829A7A7